MQEKGKENLDEYAKHDETAKKLKNEMDIAQAELIPLNLLENLAKICSVSIDKKVVKIDFQPAIVDPRR